MTTVTLTITTDDLDRLTHALLMSRISYVCKETVQTDDLGRWRNAKRNIDALVDLYKQVDAALALQRVEG